MLEYLEYNQLDWIEVPDRDSIQHIKAEKID